jgi:elongator complex protein 4
MIQSLQSCNAFISPSDRFSRLRGLTPSGSGGSVENNLAFKCTRRRLVIETLHLDVEGGIGERRTAYPESSLPSDNMTSKHLSSAVAVEVDEDQSRDSAKTTCSTTEPKISKSRKGVTFRVDHPDLYEF